MSDLKKHPSASRLQLSASDRQRLIRKFCLQASRDDLGLTLEQRQELLRQATNLLAVSRIRPAQADSNQHPTHPTVQ